MLRSLAALLFMAAPVAAAAPALPTAAPWWEKVTVTMTGDGKAHGCSYESSGASQASKECSVVGGGGYAKPTVSKAEFTKITFERRFDPVTFPTQDGVAAGDTLLGRQVMALAIDGVGKVSGCKIVASSGDMTPDYGCEEASTERFEASAGASQKTTRQGFMTILIYGHSEHLA